MADGLVDLRSDTVTRPTAEMRRAMAEAEVGDDGYGEDPTVRRLEEEFAARVGKEAALLVPSGTMANQVALRALTTPGSAVVAGRRQHVVCYEHGAAGRNAGVQFHELDDDDGTFDPGEVSWAVEASLHHHMTPRLICVEHPHMAAGGVPWPLARLSALSEAAMQAALPIHLDGARLFNAEVATGVPAAHAASHATTIMACLTKGLCAPVGSLLAGPADLMAQAREERFLLGGGMRQAGVIAAAGLVALRSMIERLAEDHRRARQLAEAVALRFGDRRFEPAQVAGFEPAQVAGFEPAQVPGFEPAQVPGFEPAQVPGFEPAQVPTNIVVFPHPEPVRLLEHLRAHGVLAGTIAPRVVRLVTHHDVDDDGIERAVQALADAP